MRMASAGNGPDPLRPQRPGGLGRGAALALLVHLGLILALALGVSWRASEPTGATAELWAAVPEYAAPAPEAPPPQPVTPPQPVPKPEPKPEVKPEPVPPREAEIAIEKAKAEREKAEKAKREREEREREREQREREAKAEAEKKRQQLQQEEQRKKLAEKADAERLEKLRQDTLKRMLGQAGATGAPTATGTAAQDAGPSASYAGRIIAKVKPNIVLTETVTGSPRAEVEVRAAADGTIIGRRLIKSSGDKAWDDAVLRALDRTEILPRDVDGRVPSPITIGFTP
jgi:colicin import membrane protein